MISASEIAESLRKDRSKKNVSALVGQMARENFSYSEYFDYVEQVEMPMKWYMTWTLNHYIESYPQMNTKNQQRLWELLVQEENESILRDLWRAFTFLKIDDDIAGAVYDKALMVSASPAYAIAIRANAITCAANICKAYPELASELVSVLSDVFENDESTAMIARCRNTLNQLKRL